MEAQVVNAMPSVASHDETVRCLLAIELSKKSRIVAVNTPLSDKVSCYTLKPCDGKELLDLCERIRTRVARETKKHVEVVSCYEAGYDGFWLHRLLEAHGIRNYVIDAASLQVDRRARQAKTDHVDAARMLRSLMAYLRGEPKVWSVVRVPSVAEEDDRRLHRERDRLISERIQHVNRIKGLLAIQGIYDYHPLRRDRMERLERLETADGRTLPPRLKTEILRELQRLELVVGMIQDDRDGARRHCGGPDWSRGALGFADPHDRSTQGKSLADWLARELSAHQGWGPAGMTRVAIGNGATAVLAAFRTNAIDADISVTTNFFNWEEKKQARLLIPASKFVGNIAAGTIYATRHLIATDPEALRGFLAAWLETIDYMSKHKAETVKIESEVTGYPQSVMAKEYDNTKAMFSRKLPGNFRLVGIAISTLHQLLISSRHSH